MVKDTASRSALQPVTNSTRRDVVVTAIKRALLSGELQPGERIKEVPLAEKLAVSRPTVRDAIAQLIYEGALVREPYRGISVAQPTAQDLLDVAAVRVSLETVAALHLARNPEGPGMARLGAALADHLEAIASGDLIRADGTHLKFHKALWEGSENQMLIRIWPLVESQIRTAIFLDQATRLDPGRDAAMHKHLVKTIAAGDEDEIIREVKEHIGRSADQAVQLMDGKLARTRRT